MPILSGITIIYHSWSWYITIFRLYCNLSVTFLECKIVNPIIIGAIEQNTDRERYFFFLLLPYYIKRPPLSYHPVFRCNVIHLPAYNIEKNNIYDWIFYAYIVWLYLCASIHIIHTEVTLTRKYIKYCMCSTTPTFRRVQKMDYK